MGTKYAARLYKHRRLKDSAGDIYQAASALPSWGRSFWGKGEVTIADFISGAIGDWLNQMYVYRGRLVVSEKSLSDRKD